MVTFLNILILFLVEKLMLSDDDFYEYWTHLTDTDSRDKAIGRHETRLPAQAFC